MMLPNILKRPALGQIAPLGGLYDARSDTFIPLSLLKDVPPDSAVDTKQNHSTDIKFSKTDTYKEKFDRLDVEPELSASFLAGLVKVEGSGRYLSEKRETNRVIQSSMHYSITTVEEELNLTSGDIKKCLAFDTLDSDVATHVVTGISWGAHCVITAKSQGFLTQNESQIAGKLEAEFGILRLIGLGKKGALDGSKEGGVASAEHSFEVTVYGDVLANDGLVPTDFDGAQRFISNVHKYIADANQGKGKPTTYTLMPLSLLRMFRILEIKCDIALRQLSLECLDKFVQLFDELREAQQNIHDYHARLCNYPAAIPPEHLEAVKNQVIRARGTEASLKLDYSHVLTQVRSSKEDDDAEKLWSLLAKYRDGECSPKNLQSIATYTEKMDFLELISREGAQYVGYQGSSLDTLLIGNPYDDAYVLYFNDQLRRESSTWLDAFSLFLELLRDKSHKKLVVAIDCDVFGTTLEGVYISQMRNTRVIVEDVLEQRKILAENCVMRCDQSAFDPSLRSNRPLTRKAIRVSCPGPYCDGTLKCNWICATCQSIVEYGVVDDLLYCDCGACSYHKWEFKCKDLRHGSTWSRYDDFVFLKLLKDLESFEELNILILGETGVGKSTWINAFINYLTHDTLDDALKDDTLRWAIPCSFSTQLKDEEDRRGRFVQKDVKIGTSKSEKDGTKGSSATQETSVYVVDIGRARVRLIDTPGIGDTRGVSQDNENMADILRVLRTYNKLHGILILLKPNAPRLTVMFRFCIKQLLSHLHRNAANNIVFGFTNTRGSNYKPGDTFKPLEALLLEYQEAQMGLYEHNVYCFDSESFRYLAARKRGIDMGLLEDNRRSWEYSVDECRRLVKHFQSITPHQVTSTINLNETRDMIVRLTEPMALIQQKIQASIEVNEDQIKELQRHKFTRSQLQRKLYVQKESLESYEVDQPRTACTHHDCVELQSGVGGRNEQTIIYKTMCHKPCYLSGVDRYKKGHPHIQKCAAIGAGGMCTHCNHNWMDHMHIYYEYRPTTFKYRDEAVDKDLTLNASDIELKEEAIRMKETAIEEFKVEQRQVQESAIQFGFFLKRHAITPYNDATLEYLDHLIDQEKMKIQQGGSKKALESLEKTRLEHVEKVKVLQRAMEEGDNEKVLDDQGVKQLITTLYALPHFGKDLNKIVTTNERAAQATYREKSFNISAGEHWSNKASNKTKKQQGQQQNYSNGSRVDPYNQYRFSNQIPGSFPGSFPGSLLAEYPTAVQESYSEQKPTQTETFSTNRQSYSDTRPYGNGNEAAVKEKPWFRLKLWWPKF